MGLEASRIDLPGHLFARYSGEVCCWCLSQSPDSREHRFKRSDLVHLFGRGPYTGRDETVVGTNEGELIGVQGPKSARLKFRPSLCRTCNGSRSQPFDGAWATFTEYVTAHEAEIVGSKAIDMREVFGDEWPAQAENVSKYVVKHAICRLAQWEVLSPAPARVFLDGGPYPECFAHDVEIRTDILTATRLLREADIPEGSLWNGPPCQVDGDSGEAAGIQAFIGYGWLRIYWAFGPDLGDYPNLFASSVVPLTEGYEMEPSEITLRP